MYYVGHQYKETKNRSFVSDELTFIRSKDILRVSIKVPFDESNTQIIRQCKSLAENKKYSLKS